MFLFYSFFSSDCDTPEARKITMNKEQFTGKIIQRQRRKVRDKNSSYFGQTNYRLLINSLGGEQQLFVYKNVVNADIFNAITQELHLDRKYQFLVKRSKWGWVLLDWEEINNNYL